MVVCFEFLSPFLLFSSCLKFEVQFEEERDPVSCVFCKKVWVRATCDHSSVPGISSAVKVRYTGTYMSSCIL